VDQAKKVDENVSQTYEHFQLLVDKQKALEQTHIHRLTQSLLMAQSQMQTETASGLLEFQDRCRRQGVPLKHRTQDVAEVVKHAFISSEATMKQIRDKVAKHRQIRKIETTRKNRFELELKTWSKEIEKKFKLNALLSKFNGVVSAQYEIEEEDYHKAQRREVKVSLRAEYSKVCERKLEDILRAELREEDYIDKLQREKLRKNKIKQQLAL